jgi:iron complex outermembrane receptor protein
MSLAVLFSCASVPAIASAQTAQSTSIAEAQQSQVTPEFGAEQSADIVVTAQKRSERLQDVPLAVTAVTSDALQTRQINDSTELVKAVPSLTYQQGTNPINSSFRIRGVGTSLFGVGTEASVLTVIDGVVSARQAQGFADLADIERVEVLRGPQGTLFGKNATAGVINVVTKDPSSVFEGNGRFTIAEGGEYHVNGSVSGPIGRDLGARLTGYYNDTPGWIHNVANGKKDNGSIGWGARGKVLWEPAGNLRIMGIAEYRKTDAHCCDTELVGVNNPDRLIVDGGVDVQPAAHEVFQNGTTHNVSSQQTYSVQGDLDLGFASLTSISAYQVWRLNQNAEADAYGYDYPVFIAPNATAQFDRNGAHTTLRNFTQEVRLASPGSDRFNYTVGAFYSNLDIDREFDRRRATCPSGVLGEECASPKYQSLMLQAYLHNYDISGFGQVEWEVVDKLKLIGGVRLQYDSLGVRGQRLGPTVPGDANFGGAPSDMAGQKAHNTAVTGKAGIQYTFSRDAQTYFTYSHGYKGLGYSVDPNTDFGNQQPVKPEYVNSYEAGFKGRTTDNLLSFSLAAFYAKYRDLQIQANRTDPTTGIPNFQQTNAGSSVTKGVELEFTLAPSREFSISGGVSYTDTSIDVDGLNCPSEFQPDAVTVPVGGTQPINTCFRQEIETSTGTTLSGPAQNVRRGVLPSSPKLRLTVSPRVELPVSDSMYVFFQTDINYQSKQSFALEQDPLSVQPGYGLVDITVGIRPAGKGIRASFFVKNLFDQNYYTSFSTSALNPSNLKLLDYFAFRPKDADRYVGASIGLSF